MAAAAMLEKFQMAISPQQLTIYLYSAHRAVIFAIAQLSCTYLCCNAVRSVFDYIIIIQLSCSNVVIYITSIGLLLPRFTLTIFC